MAAAGKGGALGLEQRSDEKRVPDQFERSNFTSRISRTDPYPGAEEQMLKCLVHAVAAVVCFLNFHHGIYA